MDAIRVTIKDYKIPFFPVKGVYKIGTGSYTGVFENVTQLKNYFIGRYYNVIFIDRRETVTSE